jgi:hypothetical protein
MIYGPKSDGTYVVEFKTADGEALSRPIGTIAVLGGRAGGFKRLEAANLGPRPAGRDFKRDAT